MDRRTALGAAAAVTLTVAGGVTALAMTVGATDDAPPAEVVTEYVDEYGNPVAAPGSSARIVPTAEVAPAAYSEDGEAEELGDEHDEAGEYEDEAGEHGDEYDEAAEDEAGEYGAEAAEDEEEGETAEDEAGEYGAEYVDGEYEDDDSDEDAYVDDDSYEDDDDGSYEDDDDD